MSRGLYDDAAALDLPSQFLLLATRDRSGRPLGYHQYGFGASVLAEMAMQGHVVIEHGRVLAVDAPDDLLYATVWHDMRTRRRRKASYWVSRLSGGRYRLLRRQFTQRLVERGLVAEQRHLFDFRYPSRDGGPEDVLRQRIAEAVASRDASDHRLVCLVAITVAAGSSAEIHPDVRVRRRIRRVARQWIRDEPLTKSIRDLVAAVTAGVVAVSVAVSSGP